MHCAMDSLDSAQLDAFAAVARLGNFSQAARELHVTQPALSRRIQALEQAIGATLFIRGTTGVGMTEAGLRLSGYVEAKRSLEAELLNEISKGRQGGHAGVLRIAGYSSVMHHIVAPVLAPFLRKHPDVQLELVATQAVRPASCAAVTLLLQRAQVDFVIGAYESSKCDLEGHALGQQRLVAVESVRYAGRADTYLDTRPEDPTTEEFFEQQKAKPTYERSFLHDEEGILKGVALGLGRAVVIDAVIPKGLPIRRVPGLKPVRQNLFCLHRKQPIYPKLFLEARQRLIEGCRKALERSP